MQAVPTALFLSLLATPKEVEAAAKIVEPSPFTTATYHTLAGAATVFTSSTTGYKFAVTSGGTCAYRKTTDGGQTWGAQVVVDSQTDCIAVSVWYDKWTPGDSGTDIHIATIDTTSDELFYNRLSTASDTLLVTTSITAASGALGTYVSGTNVPNVTKAANGRIYLVTDDANGTNIRSCLTNCNLSASWTAVGTAPQGDADSFSMLMPLSTSSVMLINRSVGNVLRSSIWNGTVWSGFTTIDASAISNATYDVGMSATVDIITGDIYLAYIADNNDFVTADHDLRTALYSTSSWSAKTAVFTNVAARGLLQVAIARNANTGDIYTTYTARTTIGNAASANVYYARSANSMTTWGTEQGPVNTVPGDFYGIDINLSSADRFFVSWFDNNAVLDIFGDSFLPAPTDTLVVLEPSPNTTAVGHTLAGAGTVFIDDQIGYKFHRYGAAPNNGMCVYRKTTDAGRTWGAQVSVDTKTDCSGISVWYDRWTPGDNGSNIHIATYDLLNDEIYYNRLDTSSDTLLLTTSTSTMLALVSIYAVGINYVSITKATDGRIYVNMDDANGTFIRSCTSACNIGTNWSAVGTPPQGNADSWSMLKPLLSGSVMLINRSTTNVIRSSIWNGTAWSSFATIDAAAVGNTTYDVGMSATVDTSTGDVYLAYLTDNDSFTIADHDLRTALYSAGAWTAKTAILTNVAGRGLLQVAIARDLNNGDIYTAYTARSAIGTAATAHVYYVRSIDDMLSWGSEQGAVSTTAGDFYGLDLNLMAFERLYVSWFDAVAASLDIFGQTLADIGPETELSAFGSQLTAVRVDFNNFYIGGTFLLETIVAKTVSSIVVSESGTIHGQNNLKNIKLYYDLDTSAPYDCVSESYSGSETQFGSSVASGFSGSDGVASFSTSPVSISPMQSLCAYVVMDVKATAQDGNTIEISVANPKNDIVLSGGVPAYPDTVISLFGTTTVVDPNLTQSGYHWRLNNGSETTASSATSGTENTPLGALQKNIPRRLRLAVSNQGSTSSLPSTYRLEYGVSTPTCSAAPVWTPVGDSGALWNLSDSASIVDGANTTNISVGSGGVSDLGTTFIASNGALRDTTNTSNSLTFGMGQFSEFEFSIVASSSVTEGATYCFRVTRSGTPLSVYNQYPQVTITADVYVGSFGTQISTVNVPSTNVYAGGVFSITENSTSRQVTGITLAEQGTVNGAQGISNLKLYSEPDASAPYNCQSESYTGSEAQYGTTKTTGFSDLSETAVFSGSATITTSSALCVYVVYDITSLAQNGELIDIAIASAATNVQVSGGGSVGPSAQVALASSTLIQGAILNQLAYHWRNDNGSETGATSATAGAQNTALLDFAQNSPIRLRMSIENTGLVSSVPTRFRLEYSPKITTCNVAMVWTDVSGSLDGWDMFNSTFITNGETSTDISIGSGGVANGPGTFVGSNGAVRDIDSVTATNTLPVSGYVDVEFSITSTNFTSYNTNYCFRVSRSGMNLNAYTQYAELTTAPKRDFKIQRGSTQVTGTSATIAAGVGYLAPASTSLAFVRITNSQYTGAGNTTATAGQNADDVTAYISNPGNIGTNFTISRPPAAISDTRVDWEIIEFIGRTGTDNEMIVRGVGTVSYTTTSLVATGTALSNVSNNSKVVVFVTGSSNQNAVRNFYASQVTSAWNTSAQAPVFTRGANGASVADISYAVVEFVGINWNVQRAEHVYATAGVTETASITAVNSLARTFIHAQKRLGATTNVVHYGHEVWLSSIGALSLRLEAGADVLVGQTSVAWVIENVQSGTGGMNVQRSSGATTAGTAPLSLSIVLSTPLEATNNTSIMANSRAVGANTTFPLPNAGFTITSTSSYQIWRSITSAALTYQVELIEWPVADLSIRQNYYRFYVDNNLRTPTDPWPIGVSNLGENTSITSADEPLGIGERVRVRMTLRTTNATMPAGLNNFKLQYALRITTCSAVSGGSWFDLGQSGSGVVWRGYTATGTTNGVSLSTDPPTGGDLLISIANRSGSLVQQNPSAANPYPVTEGDNIEYDWYIEQNGANPQSTYCFRTVHTDSTPLNGYNNYPQIRTAGFTPRTLNWRWYDDIENETPIMPLAGENVAPINVANTNTIALRFSVDETRNAQGQNIKFKLQFSDDISFTSPRDVAATSSCGERSLWCYTEGGGINNQLISTRVLSDSDVCVASSGVGCGTHNTVPSASSTHTHFADATQEYSFTIRNAAARVNAVYYFRLFDTTNNVSVPLAAGESFPSLVTEGPTLQLALAGLPAGTSTAGVITDTATTPSTVGFGPLTFGEEYVAAHRISIITNATEGYQVLKFTRQQLMGASGVIVPSTLGTNAIPQSWATSCLASSTGCVGYHTTDATLRNGSTRFAAIDTYAGFATSPMEIMYSSIPASDTHDIVYRIRVNELQPAGIYETEIVYLAVPAY